MNHNHACLSSLFRGGRPYKKGDLPKKHLTAKEIIMGNKKWYQSKTVWTGILGALTAAGGAATGELPMANAIQIGLTALIGIFLRTPTLAK